jgi:hypothetical protein
MSRTISDFAAWIPVGLQRRRSIATAAEIDVKAEEGRARRPSVIPTAQFICFFSPAAGPARALIAQAVCRTVGKVGETYRRQPMIVPTVIEI